MNDLWNYLFYFAQVAWDYICNIFKTIILDIIVNFLNDVVEYFKSLRLHHDTHKAFIMSTEESANNPFATLIPEGLKGKGIIEGVYNKDTNNIDSLRYVGGNGMDDQLLEFTKNPITILT